MAIKGHRKEIETDSITSPVEQARKRAKTHQNQSSFLSTDPKLAKQLPQTFEEEQAEIVKKDVPLLKQIQTHEEQHTNSAEFEQASDDDQDSDYGGAPGEIEQADEQDGSESDEMGIDELEHEDVDEMLNGKKKSKKKENFLKKKRTEVADANLEGDEQEDTIFIDNLPNDQPSINAMILEVKKKVRELEERFFEEEDSDFENDERELKKLDLERRTKLAKPVDKAEKALL